MPSRVLHIGLMVLAACAALGCLLALRSPAPLSPGQDECAFPASEGAVGETAAPVAARSGSWDFFTDFGNYKPRTHCMVNEAGQTDWPWVFALLGLNVIVIAGYLRIFVFWRRAYLAEEGQDRNTKLMDLAWIFLWCATCGYISSIVIFFWPGYRALAIALIPLAFFTWRFAWNLSEFRLALQAKRLQRELTESLKQRNNALELAVNTATAKLRVATRDAEYARQEAERANRAKSDFLAKMSHEIRTPMTGVLGYAELLDNPGLTRLERDDYVRTIRRNGEHLLCIVNDILDLSKIEAGRMTVERVDCSVLHIAAEVVSLLRPRALEQGLELSLKFSSPIPELLRTDPTRFRQMLTNLVGNGIKFTETGSVGIELGYRYDGMGGRLTAVVRDTGIGMTPEQSVLAFEPFHQADNSTTRRFSGTGLGLSISRRMAKMMGGEITYEPREGGGSVFRLEIGVGVVPGASLVESSDEIGLEDATPSLPRHRISLTGRILLVEDGRDNRRLIAHHLTVAGASVELAENGRQGLEAARAAWERGEPFDLIVMDIQMPVLDGISATRQLREAGYTHPIIALTAYSMTGDEQRCLDAGFDGYCSKPIDVTDLLLACRKLAGSVAGRSAA